MGAAPSFAPIDPNELAAFHSALSAPAQQQQAQQKGNFFTHLLPSIGGTAGGVGGGALGGALAGSAIMPGVGTAIGGLLGALLGGAGGGALGKVAENKVEGQGLGSGVAGQALENGLLSAGPLRLLKGAGVGAKALAAGASESGTGNALLDALNAMGDTAAKPGILKTAVNTSKQTAADRSAAGNGFGVGQTINGQLVTPDKAASLQDFIANRASQYGGLNPGTPISQATDAQALHNNVIAALGDKLGQINRAVTPEETAGIAHTMQTNAIANPALANANLNPLSSIAQQVTGATDVKGLEAARMAADKLAYPNGTDLASNQLAQQAAHARDAIDQFVSKVPEGATPAQAKAIQEYKAIKGDYGTSKDLLQATSTANNAAKGVHIPMLGGQVGDQVINGARNKANAALAGSADTAANPFGLKGVATRNIGGGALINALTQAQQGGLGAQQPGQTTADGSTPTSLSDALTSAQGTQDTLDPSTDTSNPFSQTNIEMAIAQDIANTGGKNTATLISLYNTFGKPDAASQALTTNQKNEVVSQRKALESLQAYTSQLNAAGGPEGPLKGAINGSILGNYTNPQAKGIDAQRIDVASAIAGSLNPRGTVSPVTARIISEALPSIHDSPATAQAKIANLVAQIKAGQYSADTNVGQLVANNTGQ